MTINFEPIDEKIPVGTLSEPTAAPGISESPGGGNAPSALTGEPFRAAQDLSRIFFHSPTGRPDGVFEPLLCEVAAHLKTEGVPDANMKQALLLKLAAVSAHLGYPLAVLVMADDPLSAARLIESSTATVPAGWAITCDRLAPAQLFVNAGLCYREKCIVSQDPEGLTKVAGELDLMLTRGYAVRQEILNKRYTTSLEEFRAEGYPCFIGIAPCRRPEILRHPSIIRVPVVQGAWGCRHPPLGATTAGGVAPAGVFRIRKCFKRLRAVPVAIPFQERIDQALAESGVSQPDILGQVVMGVIALVAITNQPPPVSLQEIGSYIYETDEASIGRWLAGTDRQPGVPNGCDSGQLPITATKIDYYIAKTLLESFLRVRQTSLTERQTAIFDTIKRLNWTKFQTSTMPHATDIEKIATLPKSSAFWPDREKIFQEMNRAGGEFVSLTTINTELIELCRMGVVGREKPPKQRYYKYFVMTADIEKELALPDASTIIDPVYQGREVSVINPATGQIETI